ncbi:hypothetical protein HED60_09650 [Planctomycetales bacterium ZRK34]|nr:hypothetical protein HED60_09650 [Planctomycetales bacterium ZRK34]
MASRRSRRSRSERRSHRNRLRAKRAARRKLSLESLEPRLLLTTLFGGEVFEYVIPDPANPESPGATVRITVEGDTVVEVVGVDIDDENQALLGDLPGLITGSDIRSATEILGGIGGQDGMELIGLTNIDDPSPAGGDNDQSTDPQNQPDNINFDALASSDQTGQTYGLSTGSITIGDEEIPVVQLADLTDVSDNQATLAATLSSGTLKEDLMSSLTDSVTGNPRTLSGVSAAAIDPLTGLMYVVSNDGSDQALLSVINRYSGSVTDIGVITNTTLATSLEINDVQAMAFRDDGELFILTYDFGDAGAEGDASPGATYPDGYDDGDPPAAVDADHDVALIHMGLATGGGFDADFTSAEVDVLLTVDGEDRQIEANFRYSAMAFSENDQLFAVARASADGSVTSTLHNLGTIAGAGGGTILVTGDNGRILGEISAGDATDIRAIAFSTRINPNTGAEETVLVGIDHSQKHPDTNATLARMVSINMDTPGESTLLSGAGAINNVSGLSSFTEPGDSRASLFAISSNGQSVVRGSVNTLAIEGEAGTTLIDSVGSADFHPLVGSANDGLLFFVAHNSETNRDLLYTIDVTAGNRTAIQNSLQLFGGFGETDAIDRDITAIVFDTYYNGTTDTVRLIVYDALGVNDQNQAVGNIVVINNVTPAGIAGADYIDNEGDNVFTPTYAGTTYGTRITGLEIIDTLDGSGFEAAEEFVLAVDNNGALSNLIRVRLDDQVDRPAANINRDDTNVYILGALPDPDDQSGPQRGQDIQDLTWNPLLVDPFTGDLGTLLGTDASDDSLNYIDSRGRFPTADAFMIYVTQATVDSLITVQVIEVEDDEYFIDQEGVQREGLPFGGGSSTPLSFLVSDAQTGELIIVTGDDESGSALLGARSEDLDPDEDLDLYIPYIYADLDTIEIQRLSNIGTLPALFDEVPDSEDPDGDVNEVMSGLRVVENLLQFVSTQTGLAAKLVGGNLDNLVELSVTRDGMLVYTVNDQVEYDGPGGLTVIGSQLAILDPSTGRIVGTAMDIFDVASGERISDIQGLDFADVDYDGLPNFVPFAAAGNVTGEDLFAIVNTDDPIAQTDLGNLPGLDLNVVAMTVAPGGTVYVINDTSGVGTGPFELVRVDRSLSTGQVTGATVFGEITDGDGVLITEITALEAHPVTGALYAVGIDADGDRALFTLLPQASELDGSETPPTTVNTDPLDVDDEVFAGRVAKLDGGGFATPITALAFTNDGATLYAAATTGHGAGGASSDLIEIDFAGAGIGTVTSHGQILIDIDVDGAGDETVDIFEFDFNSISGSLLAVDRGDSSGGGRVVRIVLPDADLGVDPTVSRQVTVPGTVAADLGGYGSDQFGYMYSINANGAGDDQLFQSVQDVPTLGVMNQNNGEFTVIGQLDGLSGVRAMAFSLGEGSTPGQQGLYIVGNDNVLYEVNYVIDGVDPSIITLDAVTPLTMVGALADVSDGATVVIDSMDFDRAGNLYAHDVLNGRLVDINLASGAVGANTATAQGSLRPTVGAIAFSYEDAFGSSNSGVFFAVDNVFGAVNLENEAANTAESSALMRLAGTATDSPVAQTLGKFLFGGAVTGKVIVSGSMDTFYAGWLLTGNTPGEGFSVPSIQDNFVVGGDLRSLITTDSIGTDSVSAGQYTSGVWVTVGGRLGEVRSLEDVLAEFHVSNSADVPILTSVDRLQIETESRHLRLDGQTSEGDLFSLGFLDNFDDDSFKNDTFETAQALGSIVDNLIGQESVILAQGVLYNDEAAGNEISIFDDTIDYYSVALLAGQTIQVQLLGVDLFPVQIGVYDPDGRLVYTDYDTFDSAKGQAFLVTADRPGEWRFAIGYTGDFNFNGFTDNDDSGLTGSLNLTTETPITYLLSIQNAGDIGFGAVNAEGDFYAATATTITLGRGDFGAIRVDGSYYDGSALSMEVSLGNLRSIVADTVGTSSILPTGPTLYAPNGSAGLIRATGSLLDLGGYQIFLPIRAVGAWMPGLQVGGDIQVIDAPNGQIDVMVVADGGLGILRGASMASVYAGLAPFISVNTDNVGRDGIIDLIDISGDAAAPTVYTGTGGNVRYARVGGELYEADVFGGTAGDAITMYSEGTELVITDDGGTQLTIAPELVGNEATDANGDPIMPSLTLTGFGVAGSGGIVITSITSTGGVSITQDTFGSGAAGEIGVINVNGVGTPITLDANGDPVQPAFTDPRVSVIVDSEDGGRVDIFEVTGGDLNVIANYTFGGEIVNVDATSVDSLISFGSVGLAESTAGGTLIAQGVINNTFPYNQQTTGIQVSGNVRRVVSAMGVGNLMIGGSVNAITANDNARHQNGNADVVGVHEGINAPIVIGGDLNTIFIGEGVLPSGTGNLAWAGIFVQGSIGTVHNAYSEPGLGDIRGDIVAGVAIGEINLVNGSIINADIWVSDSDVTTPEVEFFGTREFDGTRGGEVNSDPINSPTLELGSITLKGEGGIIGTWIFASDIGSISVTNGGFGILNSIIEVHDDGTISSITADGYGIRNVTNVSGASVGTITATGRGDVLDTMDYSTAVRQGEISSFDAYSGQAININNDLRTYLQSTSLFLPNYDESGIIYAMSMTMSRDLNRVAGYQIVDSTINFANYIGQVYTLDIISGSLITTGRIGSFLPGSDVTSTTLNFAGTVGRVYIRGNFDGGSQLNVSGPGAYLGSLYVLGDFEGQLNINGYVGSIYVRGDLSGELNLDSSGTRFTNALGSFRLDGNLLNGSFNVTGNVGSMYIAGSLGDPTNPDVEDQIVIDGNLGTMIVGASRDVTLEGAALNMQVIVLGDMSTLLVYGKIASAGSVVVTGDLRSALIYADTETGNAADPAPVASIGDLAADNGATTTFNVVALTRVSESRLYAVTNEGGVYRLRQIDLLPNGQVVVDNLGNSFLDLGVINDAGLNGAGTDLDEIAALEYDEFNNRLLLVGTTGVNLEMFSIDVNTLAVASVGVLLAPGGAPIAAGGSLSVRALAVDDRNSKTNGSDDTLYAILHDSTAVPHETDTLITISLTGTGQTTTVGVVSLDGVDTDIVGMDFITQNNVRSLVAVHDDITIEDDAQLLELNTSTAEAAALGEPGTVIDGAEGSLAGYTAFDGKAYAVYSDGVQDQLWQSNHSLVDGNITVGGTIYNFMANGGDVNASIAAGEDFYNFRIINGDLSVDGQASAALGDFRALTIVGGSLYGDVLATHGMLNSMSILGTGTSQGDFAGRLDVDSLNSFFIQSSVRQGADFTIANDARVFNVLGDWEADTSVTAGYNQVFTVGGDFLGSMDFGAGRSQTVVTIRGNYDGQAVIDNDATINIFGNFGQDDAGAVLSGAASMHIGKDVNSFRTTNLEGDLIIDGSARSILLLGATSNSVITTGFDLTSFNARDLIQNTLIQIGVSAGNDGVFGTDDPGDTSRMADVRSFYGTQFDNSILAVGGSITSFVLRSGMDGSSVSTGFSVGAGGVLAALNDATPLADGAERNTVRMGGAIGDTALYRGDINTGIFGHMTNSQVTTGVDAGVDGDFTNAATNSITNSLTGGDSHIRYARATSDGTGLIITDGGIISDAATAGGAVASTITYGIAEIAPSLAGVPTVVTSSTPLTIVDGANTTTIRLIGIGSLSVYDAAANDGIIDAIVVNGTNNGTVLIETRVTATNALADGAMTVNRLITSDDATLSTFRSNVNLGDSGDPVDLWLDGGVRTLSFHNMSASDPTWSGRIGSDVSTITMNRQGTGTLRIGGDVTSLTIAETDPNSVGFSLLDVIDLLPPTLSASITQLVSDATSPGDAFVFDQATGIAPITIDIAGNNVALNGAVQTVIDLFINSRLDLAAMDQDALGQLLAIAQTLNQNPTVGLGGASSDPVDLIGLTVVNDGGTDRVIAINRVDLDSDLVFEAQLVEFNTTTGAMTVLGNLQTISGSEFGDHVLQIAGDDSGGFYVLIDDRDGSGGAYSTLDGPALGYVDSLVADSNGNLQIVNPNPATPFMPPVLLSGAVIDPATQPIVGMAYDGIFGDLYVVVDVAGSQTLFSIDSTTGVATSVGVVQVGGVDVELNGIGFDEVGNLIGYNNNAAGGAELVLIDTVTPTASTFVTSEDSLRTDVDNFAFGRNGDTFVSYAVDGDYDATAGSGPYGRMFISPNALSPLSGSNIPLNVLNGDFGANTESFNITGLATTDALFTSQYWMVNLNNNGTAGDTSDDYYELIEINRDFFTGEIVSFAAITSADGSGVGADAATMLGLLGADGATADDMTQDFVFNGSAIGALTNSTTLASLGVTVVVGEDLALTDIYGTTISVDLAGDTTLGQAIQTINQAAEDAGSALRVEIHSDGTRLALTNQRQIVDNRLPGPNNVNDIQALFSDGTDLYIIGTRGSAAAQELYVLDQLTGEATSLGKLSLNGADVTSSIVALSMDSTNTIYGVLDDPSGQMLVEIGLDGTVTNLGEILIDGNPANIVSFAFDANGNLIAHEAEAGSSTPSRVVQIDVAEPDASVAVTAHGTLNANLAGLAYDLNGDAFSVYADGVVESQLWATPDISTSLTLGIVDPVTGIFSQMQALSSDFDGTPLTTGIRSMTVDAVNSTITGDVWVLADDGQLYLYDSTTGGSLVGSFGSIVNADGAALNITNIEVADNTDNGVVELLATDARFNQLVRIRLADTDADGILDAIDINGDGVFDAATDTMLTEVDNNLDTFDDGVTATRLAVQTISAPGAVNAALLLDLDYDSNTSTLQALTDTSVVTFSDASADSLGGIFASQFRSIRVTDPNDIGFGGRVVAEGEGISSIFMMGDFTGAFVSAGYIMTYVQTAGDFGGTLDAADDINVVGIYRGDFLATGVVHSDMTVRVFSLTSADSVFAGSFESFSTSSLYIAGRVTPTANLLIHEDVSSVNIRGNFEGVAEFGSANSFYVGGQLGSDAWVSFSDDARVVNIGQGAATGSTLIVEGDSSLIRVGGTARGVIATQGDVTTAIFADLNTALFAVGQENINTIITGDVTDSVISYGVWIGDDYTYNTLDDVIYGGGSNNVNIRGDYTDSAVVAGVLPSLNEPVLVGSPNLPFFNQAYIGYDAMIPVDGDVIPTFVDNAEAGGILDSVINRLYIGGDVVSGGTASVAAAADEINYMFGRNIGNLDTRVYEDPFGAPTVDSAVQINQQQFNIVFSEGINTDSFILSVDANNDGDLGDPADTVGTIGVYYLDNNGNRVYLDEDVTLAYTTLTDANSNTHGVLKVIRQDGFADLGLTIELSGGAAGLTDPAIYDRSGGRSILRDFNQDGAPAALEGAFGGTAGTVYGEDPFGTILDGNGDGIEGGDRVLSLFYADAPNSFLGGSPFVVNFDLSGDGFDSQVVTNNFTSGADIDIYTFTADAYDFLSASYAGNAVTQMAVFVRDTQGTASIADDTFEALSRHEFSEVTFASTDETIFQAFELPPLEAAIGGTEDLLDGVADGVQHNDLQFYVVVAPYAPLFNPDDSSDYILTINMAVSDELLDGDGGNNSAGLPVGEEILYISNALNDNNNELGFQPAKQLVYLNFGSGVSTETGLGVVNSSPFEVATFDPSLGGFTSTLINGGTVNGSTITGVLDHILSIYSTTALTQPFGQLTVANIGSNISIYDSATTGIYFTTVDPTTLGETDPFTEIFIGDTNGAAPQGLFGMASTVDFGNLSRSDEIVIVAETFQGLSSAASTSERLNEYSNALANVIAHELGHTLGLNHTERLTLTIDDPDNDASTDNDSNADVVNLITAGPNAIFPDDLINDLWRLGTARYETDEFPVGHSDSVDLLLRWLGSTI